MMSGQSSRASRRRMPVFTPCARASYELVMQHVPCMPLVIASGRPRSAGRSCCAMEAKKAFMSTWITALGQCGKLLGMLGAHTVFLYSIDEETNLGKGLLPHPLMRSGAGTVSRPAAL